MGFQMNRSVCCLIVAVEHRHVCYYPYVIFVRLGHEGTKVRPELYMAGKQCSHVLKD
jgi:hypothetical protein